GLDHLVGQRRVMDLLTLWTPKRRSPVFRDPDRLLNQLRLLDDVRLRVRILKAAATIGATIQRVLLGVVNLFGLKRRPLVPRMPWLAAALPLPVSIGRLRLGRLRNVTGGRLGGVARILARCRQAGLQLRHASTELFPLRLQPLEL